jgi:hypothetical protein
MSNVSLLLRPFSFDRIVISEQMAQKSLLKVSATLRKARVPYAVVGGNAVALWVSRVDESAVRSTHNIDILLRREDFDAARAAICAAGFLVLIDSQTSKARDAVHIVFANEKVRPEEPLANPDVSESEDGGLFQVIGLEALARIKLTAWRDKDRTHLRDLIDVGLIDSTWPNRLPPILADRLRQLLENPQG